MPSSKFCGVVTHVSAYVYCKLGSCLKQTLKKLYLLLDCRCPISFAMYVSGYTLYAIQDLEKTKRNCRQHGYCRPRFVISNPTTFKKQAIVDRMQGTKQARKDYWNLQTTNTVDFWPAAAIASVGIVCCRALLATLMPRAARKI